MPDPLEVITAGTKPPANAAILQYTTAVDVGAADLFPFGRRPTSLILERPAAEFYPAPGVPRSNRHARAHDEFHPATISDPNGVRRRPVPGRRFYSAKSRLQPSGRARIGRQFGRGPDERCDGADASRHGHAIERRPRSRFRGHDDPASP